MRRMRPKATQSKKTWTAEDLISCSVLGWTNYSSEVLQCFEVQDLYQHFCRIFCTWYIVQDSRHFFESIFDIIILKVDVFCPGRSFFVHTKRLCSRAVDVHNSWQMHDDFFAKICSGITSKTFCVFDLLASRNRTKRCNRTLQKKSHRSFSSLISTLSMISWCRLSIPKWTSKSPRIRSKQYKRVLRETGVTIEPNKGT